MSIFAGRYVRTRTPRRSLTRTGSNARVLFWRRSRCGAYCTGARKMVIDCGGSVYATPVPPGALLAMGGPSGLAEPFAPLGIHTYCADPKVTTDTFPLKY